MLPLWTAAPHSFVAGILDFETHTLKMMMIMMIGALTQWSLKSTCAEYAGGTPKKIPSSGALYWKERRISPLEGTLQYPKRLTGEKHS